MIRKPPAEFETGAALYLYFDLSCPFCTPLPPCAIKLYTVSAPHSLYCVPVTSYKIDFINSFAGTVHDVGSTDEIIFPNRYLRAPHPFLVAVATDAFLIIKNK